MQTDIASSLDLSRARALSLSLSVDFWPQAASHKKFRLALEAASHGILAPADVAKLTEIYNTIAITINGPNELLAVIKWDFLATPASGVGYHNHGERGRAGWAEGGRGHAEGRDAELK